MRIQITKGYDHPPTFKEVEPFTSAEINDFIALHLAMMEAPDTETAMRLHETAARKLDAMDKLALQVLCHNLAAMLAYGRLAG